MAKYLQESGEHPGNAKTPSNEDMVKASCNNTWPELKLQLIKTITLWKRIVADLGMIMLEKSIKLIVV